MFGKNERATRLRVAPEPIQIQRGHLNDARSEGQKGVAQGASLDRVGQIAYAVVVDQGDGKDFIAWEPSAEVQIIAGSSE